MVDERSIGANMWLFMVVNWENLGSKFRVFPDQELNFGGMRKFSGVFSLIDFS